jgi:hypothetical protein
MLEALPAIQEHKEQLKLNRVIPVSEKMATQWEAEHGSMDVTLSLVHDALASKGAYLWEAEDAPGERSGGSGKVRYTLEVKEAGPYRLAGRFLSPTPDDDSFFVSIVAQDGTPVLTSTVWSVGVRSVWGWNMFSLPKQGKPAELLLPKGRNTLTLQTREAGTKVDQLSLTPIAR